MVEKDGLLSGTFFDSFQVVNSKEKVEEVKEDKKEEEKKDEKVENTEEVVEATEEKAEEVVEDETSLEPFVKLLEEKGIIHIDDTKEYEDSEDGLAQIISDTVEKKKSEWIESLPEEGKELIEFIKAGGQVKDWVETNSMIDYSEVDIEDETNQEDLVREHYEALGWEKKDIEEQVGDFKELGKLKKQAEAAQRFLIKETEKKKVELIEKQKEVQKQQEVQRTKVVEEIENTIYKIDEVAGFKLTKKEQDKLKDYLLKPGKDGKTAAQKNSESLERRIKLAYLDMMDFKFGDVKTKAVTETTRTLRKTLSKYTDTASKGTGKTVEVQTESRPTLKGTFFDKIKNTD